MTASGTSDQARRQEALRRYEELELLYRTAPVGLALIDRELRYIRINDRLAAYNGRPAVEHIGRTIYEMAPLIASELEKHFRRIFETGQPVLNIEIHGAATAGLLEETDSLGQYYPVKAADGRVEAISVIVVDITQRKQVERILRQERDFSDAMISSLPGVFYLYDENRKFLRWNKNFEHVTGYTATEIATMSPLDFFAGADKQLVDARIGETFQKGASSAEAGFVAKDGKVFPYYFTGVRAQFDGRTCLIGVGIDITERRRAEEARQLTEARYRALFEYAPDGIVIADPQGRYLAANASIGRMLGYAPQELIGRNAVDIVAPAEIPHIAPAISEIKAHADYHREWRFRRKDGTIFAAEVIATMMPDGNLLAMIRDITERKAAEISLQVSEQRFRQLAENINEIFWITDPAKEHMLYISPAYEKIWGRTCEDLYKSPKTWIEAIHPVDRERVVQAAQTKQLRGEYEETYRVVRPDGTIRWVRDRAFPVADERGEIYRVVGTTQDITERKQLEEQLRQSQKMEAIGQLSGGVAHDFNNLLTVINGHIGLLQMRDQVTPEIANSIEQIAAATNRAGNLTRHLLTFSRQQVMQQAEYNLSGLVANLVKMLRRLLNEDIDLQVSYAPQPLAIRADEGMVEQVLLNLVVNARDAMSKGGKLRITTEAVDIDEVTAQLATPTRPCSFASLVVSDTGTGIEPAVLSRIFEPFFTTKEVGKGTGLGLATVYGIMQQHGGWISVASELGHGTTFRACFPRLDLIPPEVVAAGAVAIKGGHETILFVEDEVAVRNLGQAALASLGYRVIVADNGQEALQLWQIHQHEIDLLLTDLVMPGGVNGRQLAERLLAGHPRLPVIYMSGYSHEVAGKDFPLEEGRNYLAKPFDIAKLAATVRARLDKKGSRAPFSGASTG